MKETARARSPIGTDSARTEYEEPERDQSRGGDAHGAREPERDRVEVDACVGVESPAQVETVRRELHASSLAARL